MKSLFLVFANWRMAVVLLTGFSCGIPFALTAGTLQAWMTVEKIDLRVIGWFFLVGTPYTLKYLWAPFLDRYVPPFLGRRRGWIVICQIAVAISTAAMAFSDPVSSPGMLALMAILIAFSSATQDIAVDAYRTEILKKEEFGAGSSLYILGYRVGLIVSGGGAMVMASYMPWKTVYLIMAVTMAIGVVATILAPEPEVTSAPQSLRDAVVLPFIEYFKRRGAIEMLIFILIYKIDVAVALAMATPFMIQIGFSPADIGVVMKGFGIFATIFGALVGGALMIRWGLKKSLWVFGILQGVSGFTFMMLARVGHNYPMMVAAVTIENVCSGLGTAAFSAFIMSLCDKRFTATQYALLTSFMAITRIIVGVPSGYMAKYLPWDQYFLVSILIMIPGLLLLTRFDKWTKLVEEQKAGSTLVEPAAST